MSKRSGTEQTEFGDFQTPIELARECCRVVREQWGFFETIVEPTCGEGAFVQAAAEVLEPHRLFAYEIHQPYVMATRRRASSADLGQCKVKRQDFFATDWTAQRGRCQGRVLFLGNPPWVTSSALGAIASENQPRKSNVEGLRGIDALTGRSNFDISESMLRTLLDVMRPDHDALAMLVKTATARKTLKLAWSNSLTFSFATAYQIDAKQSFGVSVDACLLLLQRSNHAEGATQICLHSPNLTGPAKTTAFGWKAGKLVSDPSEATATEHLQGDGRMPWRSGVKHDLASVLELYERDGTLFTADDQSVDVEADNIYPLAKGSDVANQRVNCERRRILLPQRTMNESTETLPQNLPRTYRYLQSHRDAFAARKSSIYRNRDPFAIFGIGDYTFAPWKIAICGLYKHLTFTLFGPVGGRPVVFDDTVYSLSFETEALARDAHRLLESDCVRRYFNARVFWDAKRPITAELLRRLDLAAVAEQIGTGT